MPSDQSTNRVAAYSVVIPAHDEAESLGGLIDELFDATRAFPPREVIVVDDGSSDLTADVARAAAARHGAVVLVRHPQRVGKSAALLSGAGAATTNWIITIDADGQNDPRDVPALIGAAERSGPGTALVAGLRRRRQDSASKRLASRFANGLRQRLLGDRCPDTACGFKLIRRDVLLALPFFDGLHRFLPALVQVHGWTIEMVPVNDRPRELGRSKYSNWERGLVGFFDLLGVIWLKQRTRRPAPDTIVIEQRELSAAGQAE